ncbi:MAG: response regulator [Methanocalculus sp. MSAO_Arc1]|uniref:response regulator n=1 Tax=Methanocalculus TaxID=71151 RepID=UPI000FF4FF40|nr:MULTISPECIES: response regulator [unclassified Methanocalculus]MCP1662332.1 CheY-like chemotaxis protein [Methanocalculus sp. AMF5]RQD81515.1 MAG: response regulator [Methanocalculus sp. MSAO_Arc1]
MNMTKQILIVEDDPLIARILSDRLKKLGYGVSGMVTSADDAIMHAIEFTPDLVMMDIGLEGKASGISAAKYIYLFFSIPVVFCTAYSGLDCLNRAKEAMPFGFVQKPFTDRDLLNSIEMAMNSYEAYRQTEVDPHSFREVIHLDLGIIFVDADGKIIYSNPYAEHMTSISHKKSFFESIERVIDYDHAASTGYKSTSNSLLETVREVAAIGRATDIVIKSKIFKKRKAFKMNVKARKDKRGAIIGYMIKLEEDFNRSRELNKMNNTQKKPGTKPQTRLK